MLETLKTYLRLLSFIKGYWWAFFLSIFGFLLFAASQPALAKLMELIIAALQSKDTSQQALLPLLAIGIFFLRGLGTFIGIYFNSYMSACVIRKIQKLIYAHILTLPAEFYDRHNQGEILHRMGSGVSKISGAITNALKILVREGFTVIFLIIYVFWMNWKLSLIFLTVTPLLAYIVSYTTRRFKSITRKTEKIAARTLQVSKELIGNHFVVRGFGTEEYEKSRYEANLDDAFAQGMKMRKLTSAFTPISQLIIAAAMSGIIYMLLSESVLEQYTAASLVGYLTAIALLPKSLRQLSSVGLTIQQGAIGAEIIFELLEEQSEKDEGDIELKEIRGQLDIRELRFCYPGSDKLVLDNISFTISPGEMVALVGRSGSGKSTLASLIPRLYAIEDGRIFIDDIDINRLTLKSLRQHIASVNQNIALFDDTIFNNVAYGQAGVPEEQVVEALTKAHAMEFVSQLPEGIHTRIGENGLRLSGGQRQRLSIARAFFKNAPILIMDEATSALDNESEAIVSQAIEELVETRTTLVIAHRLSTILKADRLVVMQEGKIIETGTHQELLANEGYYSQLYRSEYSE